MRKLLIYVFLLTIISCKAQEKFTMRYISHQYNKTKNNSFINDELRFIKDKDTVNVNIKLPYDSINSQIIDKGIFYNCHLKQDTIYTISLKKICVEKIPISYNTYYKINCVFDNFDCSNFKEIEKNTNYFYQGNYGMYVDINNVLYEVIGLSPSDDCVFQH